MTRRLRALFAIAAAGYAVLVGALFATMTPDVAYSAATLSLLAIVLGAFLLLVLGALGAIDHDRLLLFASCILAMAGLYQLSTGSHLAATVSIVAAIVVVLRYGHRAQSKYAEPTEDG